MSGDAQAPDSPIAARCAEPRREIARIIRATRERRYHTFWLTAYSMGLRLGETLNLRVRDIDARRAASCMCAAGKGRKNRFVVLPRLTLQCLRRYWRDHRRPALLFPGRALIGRPASGVMDRGSTQKAFGRVVADCGIHKKVSIHSLRHAYATHLIEVGAESARGAGVAGPCLPQNHRAHCSYD